MKHLFFNTLLIVVALFVTSCKMTDAVVEDEVVMPTIAADSQPITEPEVQLAPKVEVDPEYARSIGSLSGEISYDTFQSDKTDILAIIAQLDTSMRNRDYGKWREYLTPASISYWSSRVNLQVLAARLPDTEVSLRSLGDYFTYMFIPSRIGRSVNEIRYISPTEIKAVQVQNEKDIIYYEFTKIDGVWLVTLPPLKN